MTAHDDRYDEIRDVEDLGLEHELNTDRTEDMRGVSDE